MGREIISTPHAPEAIGTYSQAVKVGSTVFVSGQIPLDPTTMELVDNDVDEQIHQVFKNLSAVAEAAGGCLAEVVKLNVFLTDLGDFGRVNAIMAKYFSSPYPARAAVGVAALQRNAKAEMEAILSLS